MIANRLLLIVAALFLTALSAHAQELRRILYGTSTSISHLPVWVGKDTGLVEKARWLYEELRRSMSDTVRSIGPCETIRGSS